MSPLFIFILEEHLSSGVNTFILGDRLFEANVHPRYKQMLGPMDIILLKASAVTRTMPGVGNYFIAWRRRASPYQQKVDWLDISHLYERPRSGPRPGKF